MAKRIRKTIQKLCIGCNEKFDAPLHEHKRGRAKYCSLSCSSKHNKKPKNPNCTCSTCGVELYRNKSQKSNSKSNLFFCSRKCKDKAQCISGIPDLHLPHYGTGKWTYRGKAFNNLPNECNECGYDEHPQILIVHHKDCDRTNNKLENLEILCPTCHSVCHFLDRTGNYSNSKIV